MAVRPIDGNELYRIEKLLDTDIVRQDKVALNLLEQVLYDIQHVPTLTPPNEWVSVENAVPDPGERVLATDGTFVGEAYRTSANTWYRHTGFPWRDCLQSIVTLWMPLPTADKDNHVPAKAPNEPLTLEQLREMDEIPIYVVTEKYGSGWCVLNWHGVKKSYTYFSRTGTSEGMTATPLSAKTYGDLWIAYRRPPEGAEIQPSKQARAGALCGIQII